MFPRSALPSNEPRCLLCGAVVDGTAHCSRCGADAPAGARTGEMSLACPRCGRAHSMEVLHFEGGALQHCKDCGGAFIAPLDWGALLELASHGKPTVLGLLVPPPPGAGPSPEAMLRLLPCPSCGREMDRFRFAASSTSVVDACSQDGMWFDPGELAAAVNFVKEREARGGQLSDEERADLRDWEERKLAWVKDERAAEQEQAQRTAELRAKGLDADGSVLTGRAAVSLLSWAVKS